MVQEVTIKLSLPSVEKFKEYEKYLAPLGVFLIALAVYIKTLAPSIVFGDAGELILAANSLGIAHPPGFPLWCIFTKFFTLLPISNIAWRANLATAFYSSVTVALTFILIQEVLSSLVPRSRRAVIATIAFFLSLSLAFTRNLWSDSVSAEVYTLDLLFSVLNTLVLFYWYKNRDHRFLVLLSFLMGLSLTNHYIVGLLYPAFVIFVLVLDWKIIKNWKLMGSVLLAFLVGLLPYLYLPLRSRANPAIDWGHPATWEGFVAHVTRQQYGKHDVKLGVYVPLAKFSSIGGGVTKVFKIFWYVLEIVWRELSVVAIFSLLGLIYLFKKDKRLLLLFGLLIFFRAYLFMFLTMLDRPATRASFTDLMFLFVAAVVLAAVGIYWCLEVLKERQSPDPAAVKVGAALLPLFFLIRNYSYCDMSHNRIALDHAWNVLNTIEEEGTLIFAEDFSFPVLYLLKAEGERPDITLLERAGNIYPYAYDFPPNARSGGPTAYRAILNSIEQEIMDRARSGVYYATHNSCEEVPKRGILTLRKEAPPDSEGTQIDMARDYANILQLTPEEVGHRTIDQVMASFYHLSLGFEHFRSGYKDEGTREFLISQSLTDLTNFSSLNNIAHCWSAVGEEETALALLNEAARLRNNHPGMQFNLGMLNTRLGNLEIAAESFERAIELDPEYLSLAGKRLGAIYLKQTRWEEALEVLGAVEELDPLGGDSQFHYGLGVALFNLGRPQEALEYFEKVLAVDEKHIKSWEGRGLCYFRLGQYQKARESFQELLDFNPTNELALRMLAKPELE